MAYRHVWPGSISNGEEAPTNICPGKREGEKGRKMGLKKPKKNQCQ